MWTSRPYSLPPPPSFAVTLPKRKALMSCFCTRTLVPSFLSLRAQRGRFAKSELRFHPNFNRLEYRRWRLGRGEGLAEVFQSHFEVEVAECRAANPENTSKD